MRLIAAVVVGAALFLLPACGMQRSEQSDHRYRESDGANGSSAASNTFSPSENAPTTIGSNADEATIRHAPAAANSSSAVAIVNVPEISDEEVSRTIYDEVLDRSIAMPYYQSASALRDLFLDPSNPKTSQLCWPTALAYQMEYQRRYSAKLLTKLSDASPDNLSPLQTNSVDVRHLASICGTDSKLGTTLPQGAACIAALYEHAGYRPDITIIGNDAQWADLGMYPKDAVAKRRSVNPTDLRVALQADQSVILLIGYYRFDKTLSHWQRLNGHFVSVTGYAHRTQWENQETTIRLVNPAIDYHQRDQASSLAKVRQFDRSRNDSGLPEDASLALEGSSLQATDSLLVIESAIIFGAKDSAGESQN